MADRRFEIVRTFRDAPPEVIGEGIAHDDGTVDATVGVVGPFSGPMAELEEAMANGGPAMSVELRWPDETDEQTGEHPGAPPGE